RPQQPHRGSREVPGGAAALGPDHAGRVRRARSAIAGPALPRPDRGQHAHGAAAREQHRPGGRAGARGGAGRLPVAPHQLDGRGARAPDRARRARRAPDPADPRPRVGRGGRRRSSRRSVRPRAADGRHRAGGRGARHARRDLRPTPRGVRGPPAVGDVLIRGPGRALGALVALGLLLSAAPARAGLADRVGATFVLIAEEFVRAFQPLEGLIVGVEGDALYLDLGESRGAQAGQELLIFRKGEEFYHPLTGKPLGRYEETVGWAQIRRVQPRFSEALYVPLDGKPRPRADDGVRITRGRIKIAIAPVLDLTQSKADLRRVPYLLSTVFELLMRFHVAGQLAGAACFL